MTNLINLHTCATCSVDVIASMVPIPHRELLKITGDMIYRAGVRVPISVDVVGESCHSRDELIVVLLDTLEGGVEPLVAADHSVAILATKLASAMIRCILASNAAATATTVSMAVTMTVEATPVAPFVSSHVGGGTGVVALQQRHALLEANELCI